MMSYFKDQEHNKNKTNISDICNTNFKLIHMFFEVFSSRLDIKRSELFSKQPWDMLKICPGRCFTIFELNDWKTPQKNKWCCGVGLLTSTINEWFHWARNTDTISWGLTVITLHHIYNMLAVIILPSSQVLGVRHNNPKHIDFLLILMAK